MIANKFSQESITVPAYSRCRGARLAFQQQFRHADDGIQGRADFVAHVGQEVALGPTGGLDGRDLTLDRIVGERQLMRLCQEQFMHAQQSRLPVLVNYQNRLEDQVARPGQATSGGLVDAHVLRPAPDSNWASSQNLLHRGVQKQRCPISMAKLLKESLPRQQPKDRLAFGDNATGQHRVPLKFGIHHTGRRLGRNAEVVLFQTGQCRSH